MIIYLKSVDNSVNNIYRHVKKFDSNFTTNPKDAILYALKAHYSTDVKLGDIILERSSNKHNFDLFCITTITYKKTFSEKVPISIINADGSTEKSLSYFEKLEKKDYSEQIRIEVKLNKNKNNNEIIQKIKNLIFKCNLIFR
jgi:translation elongation factor EF-1alpha